LANLLFLLQKRKSKQKEKNLAPLNIYQKTIIGSRLIDPCTKQRRKGLVFFAKKKK